MAAEFNLNVGVDPRRAVRDITRIGTQLAKLEGQSDRLRSSLKRALIFTVVGIAVQQLISFSDTLINTENRLRIVTNSTQELNRAMDDIFAISRKTRLSFEATATIYTRVAVAARELGIGQQELADFTTSVLTRIDPEINFRWNQGSPDPGIDSNTFSVRWTGVIVSDATDTHEYRFQHNDGIRVWIDGAPVVDAFTSSAQNQESMINIFLTQGPHEITIEYFENTGRAIMRLSERNDRGGGFSIVPSTQLFSEPLELLVLDTEFIPSGNIDQNYSELLSASGGFMPYQWQVSQGILPTGLVLDSLTGEIAGIPTQGGIFPLTLLVEDASFQAAERDVTLTILGGTFLEDLLVDNTDPECTFVGTWFPSTQRSGFFGTNYQKHRSGNGSNTATWRMSVANSGDYEVFARWVTNNNHATNAKYTVNHAEGSTVVQVDQSSLGGQWVSLGVFNFTGGVVGIVLSDDADGLVIADAVMMEPLNVVINQPPVWDPVPPEQAIIDENFQYDISSFATDPDGDDVFFTLVNPPAWANISANGIMGGTPTAADLGQYLIGIQADDARGGTANAFVGVNVVLGEPIVLDIQLFNISDNQVKADRILTFDMSNFGDWKTALQYVRLEYKSPFTETGWAVFMYTENGTDINPFLIRLIKPPSGDNVDAWQTYRGL
ncbi:hypothetical protein IIB34_05380, partial [PVC group bacterium]|nr:hypothetical protein [PVC group bacterium]